jgi:hypothetical protein
LTRFSVTAFAFAVLERCAGISGAETGVLTESTTAFFADTRICVARTITVAFA